MGVEAAAGAACAAGWPAGVSAATAGGLVWATGAAVAGAEGSTVVGAVCWEKAAPALKTTHSAAAMTCIDRPRACDGKAVPALVMPQMLLMSAVSDRNEMTQRQVLCRASNIVEFFNQEKHQRNMSMTHQNSRVEPSSGCTLSASMGESMAAAHFASMMLGFGLSLVAPPMAHAIVELDPVVWPSLAACQRAWMNCALNTAEELLTTAPALNSTAIADRAIASCRKGEDLMEEAMFDDRSIFGTTTPSRAWLPDSARH